MYFIVIESDEKYVFVVDGNLRKIENAKKKKIKHIEMTPMFSDVIAQKVANKNKISNQDVKKSLKEVLRDK
ncbi:MAG: RNA-binding protein [Clostridia bacterium]|nr:RNA-binding protein [Clostridia bacterium]